MSYEPKIVLVVLVLHTRDAIRSSRSGTVVARPLAQPRPVRPGRVALVRQQPVRALTWPSGRAGHADLVERVERVERVGQHGRARDLATGQDERQRPPLAVGDQVRLGRQPATGAADRVISGFILRTSCCSTVPPVSLGRVAPCWWTRTIVESIDVIQSMSPPC
jgi:hypothetical protein